MSDDLFCEIILNISREYTVKLASLIVGIDYDILASGVFNIPAMKSGDVEGDNLSPDITISAYKKGIYIELNKYYYKGVMKKNMPYIFNIDGEDALGEGSKKGVKIEIQILFNDYECESKLITKEEFIGGDESENFIYSVIVYTIDLTKLNYVKYTKGVNKELIQYLKVMASNNESELDELVKENGDLQGVVKMIKKYSQDKKVLNIYNKKNNSI